MKYLLSVLFICLTFSSFAQKEHPEQKMVEKTARSFIKLIVSEKYNDAKKISAEGTKTMLEQMKMFSSMIPDSMLAEMKERRQKMQNATITFKRFDFKNEKLAKCESHLEAGRLVCMAYFISSEEPNKEEQIYLIKEYGNWIVDLEAMMPSNESGEPIKATPPPSRPVLAK